MLMWVVMSGDDIVSATGSEGSVVSGSQGLFVPQSGWSLLNEE